MRGDHPGKSITGTTIFLVIRIEYRQQNPYYIPDMTTVSGFKIEIYTSVVSYLYLLLWKYIY